MSLAGQILVNERLRTNGTYCTPPSDDYDTYDLETLIGAYVRAGMLPPPRRGMSKKMYRLYLIKDHKRTASKVTATGDNNNNLGAREVRRTLGL